MQSKILRNTIGLVIPMAMIPVGSEGELRYDLLPRKKPKVLDPKRWDLPYHQ